MPYVAPGTKASNTVLTSAEWNVVANDIIDLNSRIQRGTYAARPVSPAVGDLYYQTNTDELIKYVTDLDSTDRWMAADHDYQRNLLVNGSFDIWQRGVAFNPASATSTSGQNYGADRWQGLQATSQVAGSFINNGPGVSNPPKFTSSMRVQRQSGAVFTTPFTLQQSIETLNLARVRSKYLTLSFWARCGSSYSASGSGLVSNIVAGTGTDNTVGNFTGNTVLNTTTHTLTTTWKRFVVTLGTLFNDGYTQLGVQFVFTPVGTAGVQDYYDIVGVQLEIGTAPSDFELSNYGDTLRQCQRYYYRVKGEGSGYAPFGSGTAVATTLGSVHVPFPTTMRTRPTAIETTGTATDYVLISGVGTYVNASAVPTLGASSLQGAYVSTSVASGLTAGQGTTLVTSNNGTSYLGFNAEL